MRTITTEIFTYDELGEAAKEKARDWYRNASVGCTDFADFVLEGAVTVAACLGIEIARDERKTRSGALIREPKIYYSGFYSQGDGACFVGTWRADKMDPEKLRASAPTDEKLNAICATLVNTALRFPELSFTTAHIGPYSHEHSVDFSFDFGDEYYGESDTEKCKAMEAAEECVKDAARDFMRWIYRQLEESYNGSVSDESVAETIITNEYEFTANGEKA